MLKKYIHIRFQKRNGYAWADKSDFKAIPVEESFEKKMQKELVPVVFQIKYKMEQQSSDLMVLDSSWFGKCLNCHKRIEVIQW